VCGIVGVVAPQPVDERVIVRMRDTLAHRGPDASGVWRAPDGRVCLGHRRLAIIDLSADANQPWRSADGRFVATFNGELYNFHALRRELERSGIEFRTSSDTEVLVEAYRAWGAACLQRFVGMFAFAIWDQVERLLFCARDRAGEKPFHFALIDDAFIFGSELKALVAWPGFRKRLNGHALVDFLTFGFIPDPRTIWEGVCKLSPGHMLLVRVLPNGRPAIGRQTPWWDLRFEVAPAGRQWTPLILEALRRAAADMSIADVPLGAFLSGGVDSSSVVAALNLAGHHVRSFTIGFTEQEYDERPWAQLVADRYQTSHAARVVEPGDVESVFDRLVWHFDEPFGDYSYFPTYFVCREARKVIKVSLSGDGADELFAGYQKYQRLALREAWGWALPQSIAALGARLLRNSAMHERTLRQYAVDAVTMLGDCLVLGSSPRMLRRHAHGVLARALEDYDPLQVVREHLTHAPPSEVGLINAMRYLDLKLTLGAGILVKVDRTSMAVGLEVRPVYLHPMLLSIASQIPPSQLADWRQAKRILKSALETWLPHDLLYRSKKGFAIPLRTWLGRSIEHRLEHAAVTGRLGEFVDPSLLTRIATIHAGGRDLTAQIHNFLFLDRWLRMWT
jgi:asparagine synthase (glutamine-hydrolysing)